MADLTTERMRTQKFLRRWRFTLTSGKVAYKGHGAAIVRATGQVVPWDNVPGLIHIGTFTETVDASAAAKLVEVDFGREIILEFFENDATTPVSATTDIGALCYQLDNHTVTGDGAAGSVAGRVWIVSSSMGVGIERLSDPIALPRELGPTLSFTAADCAPTAIQCGAVYSVPTTAANSTISLPAASPDGTWAVFCADGSANGHTVQYRDVSTAITTALTASKRHMVTVQKAAGKWLAAAYVSP